MPSPSSDVVEEEVPGHPLAHQPTLEIGEGDEHGVDIAGADVLPKVVEPRASLLIVLPAYSGVT